MNQVVLRLRGIDPLLFRDGRPFSAQPGAQLAQTLRYPYPSTVAGFIRTLAGNGWQVDWKDEAAIQRVMRIRVSGPLLERNGQPVLRAPADALIHRNQAGEVALAALRPQSIAPEEGCNLPAGLSPLLPTVPVTGKPPSGYEWWSWQDLIHWLADDEGGATPVPSPIHPPDVEERMHVAIDDQKGTSREGLLFGVQLLSFERYRWHSQTLREQWSLLVRVEAEEPLTLRSVGLLGGEKRLTAVEQVAQPAWPPCPEQLRSALQGAKRVRMIVATPAIFQGGWKPGWLDDQLEGMPPGASQVRLRLVSASVYRHEAVSGWDYRIHQRGPKPVRWLVPQGSVYFFEVVSGEAGVLADALWLQSVCDSSEDQRDGFGLALWAIW